MTAYLNVLKHDPYKILGVNHNASKEEIRRAYKRLIQKYHLINIIAISLLL